MKIDIEQARKILIEEIEESQRFDLEGEWVDIVQLLTTECKERNKTMIAMLGTALLAKATSISVDPFSLKVGKNQDEGSYSARNLCKQVLAAEANRLGIDLGVTGREPLNNQPFFGQDRVSSKMNVHSTAKKSFEILLDALTRLEKIKSTKSARNALRSFLFVRKKAKIKANLGEQSDINLGYEDFLTLTVKFVSSNSENGKRAQAVAAGLLANIFGKQFTKVGKINDPSRRFPGDIGIEENKTITRAFEVRDKPVTPEDILFFIANCKTAGINKCGIIAISQGQSNLDIPKLFTISENREISLGLYFDWETLIRESLFWSKAPALSINTAHKLIAEYLEFIEVSDESKLQWNLLE